MRRLVFIGVMATALWPGLAPASLGDISPVRLNTVGYLPQAVKRASVTGGKSAITFSIINARDKSVAFQGQSEAPVLNVDTGEQLSTADFSKLRTPGVYYLQVAGIGRSPEFHIAANVYDEPYRVAMLGMYLWRCGTAVSAQYQGHTYSHDACHLEDGYLDFVGGGHVRQDGTRGWHDAGDYNKYVVNAGFSVGVMLQAWEQFASRLKTIPLHLPESGHGTPDFLCEVRWELEWLLTMQASDGRVYHKLSTQKFGGFVLPEKEKADRYFVPWSSAATADFVAVIGMSARDYQPFDPAFARRCLHAAEKSQAFLESHPEGHLADQKGFSTGPYSARDPSARLWAAVEMWETTGEGKYLKDFEKHLSESRTKANRTAGWGDVTNLAVYTYLLSNREGRDSILLQATRQALIKVADQIVQTSLSHEYGRPLGAAYYWGCNGDVAQQVQTLQAADRLAPNGAYSQASLAALDYLFGRNPFGRSFVTGIGHSPPLHPHDRRSGATGMAWPGYLVGGGWPKATDWRDEQANYQGNEIAINWNATLIFALADVCDGSR